MKTLLKMKQQRTFEEFSDMIWSSIWTDEDRIVFREKLASVLRPLYDAVNSKFPYISDLEIEDMAQEAFPETTTYEDGCLCYDSHIFERQGYHKGFREAEKMLKGL